MAAPVQRYSDPRLYGVTFTKPLNKSYEWISARVIEALRQEGLEAVRMSRPMRTSAVDQLRALGVDDHDIACPHGDDVGCCAKCSPTTESEDVV